MLCVQLRRSFGTKLPKESISKKKLKFEKRKRKDKKIDIVVQEEESDNNYMSDDSSASSNDSESQVSRNVVKEDFWPKKNKAENPFVEKSKKPSLLFLARKN